MIQNFILKFTVLNATIKVYELNESDVCFRGKYKDFAISQNCQTKRFNKQEEK